MKAILFIVRKEIKNAVLDMFRHPARLILYLGILAMLSFSLLSNMETRKENVFLDFRILHGIYLAALLFISVPSILSGLKSGATFFKMSDVNFLFVSPISPKKILAYGLVKQMASSLLMMAFLLFYGGTAAKIFGVTPWQTVALVAGIALLVFTIQVITLLIYSYTSGRPERVRFVKICVYALLGVIVAFVLFSFLNNGSDMEALYAAIASPYLAFVPVAGWIKGMIFAIVEGNATNLFIYAALNIIALAGSILLFSTSNSDYYEDVLQTTETTFGLKKAMKEGRPVNKFSTKTVKVTDTGINHGWGADTFFFKHIRQNKRRSRIPFIGVSTFVLLAVNVVMTVIVKAVSSSDAEMMPTGILMAISLALSCYILFFFNVTGDWTLELMKPYIYLVPEKAFSKLIWASMSTIIKPLIDGVIVFTALGIFLHANPFTALLCILLYGATGLLFTAGNVLSQRVFGQVVNKGLLMMGYLLMLIILFAPGITVSAVLYNLFPNLPGIIVGLPIFIWNILVSVGIFAACRNLLSTVELNN